MTPAFQVLTPYQTPTPPRRKPLCSRSFVRLFKTVHGRQTREAVFAGAGGRVLISETSCTDALPDGLKRDISSYAYGNPDLARFHIPIDAYEGEHRFDPDAEWTAEEERVLVRRNIPSLKITASLVVIGPY